MKLLGWQTSAQVRDALRAARGLAMASFAEGLPVALMEPLALGRPVVSTAIAGVPELVRDGQSGFLVPAGSVAGLSDGLRRLLQTPVVRPDGDGPPSAADRSSSSTTRRSRRPSWPI